jgi:hypothetical protein
MGTCTCTSDLHLHCWSTCPALIGTAGANKGAILHSRSGGSAAARRTCTGA